MPFYGKDNGDGTVTVTYSDNPPVGSIFKTTGTWEHLEKLPSTHVEIVGGIVQEKNQAGKDAADEIEPIFTTLKIMATQEIHAKSKELIAKGFTYNSKVFPLDQNSQIMYQGWELKRLRGTIISGDLPTIFQTADGTDTETIADAVELKAFIDLADSSWTTIYNEGLSLVSDILNAIDMNAIRTAQATNNDRT